MKITAVEIYNDYVIRVFKAKKGVSSTTLMTAFMSETFKKTSSLFLAKVILLTLNTGFYSYVFKQQNEY